MVYSSNLTKFQNFLNILDGHMYEILAGGTYDAVLLVAINIDKLKSKEPNPKKLMQYYSSQHLTQLITDSSRNTEHTRTLIVHIAVNREDT